MSSDPLPRTCCPCMKIEDDCYDWAARHELKCRQVAERSHDLVLIGDSITHFWHDENGLEKGHESLWNEFFSEWNVLNLGYGFDRPQNTLWHLENGELEGQVPKLIVLNLGTNCFSITSRYDGDTPEIAFLGIRAVIEKLFLSTPESHLLLMGVFPRWPEEIQKKIDRLNPMLEQYASTDPRITFLSLRDSFLKNNRPIPSLYVDQYCHPSNAGYRIWFDAMKPFFRKYLGGLAVPAGEEEKK